MITTFYNAFIPVLWALIKIFAIALGAGILVRTKLLPQNSIKLLSQITVKILLPLLIFTKIVQHFEPTEVTFWWMLPILAIIMIGSGLIISSLLFLKELPAKKNMLALASMQNANYLVLPLGLALFPEQADEFLVYCFLFVLGVSPTLWSLGKYLATTDHSAKVDIRKFITPPLIANILAITVVLTGVRDFIPEAPLSYMGFIGELTIPLAMFILGATLGGISLSRTPIKFDLSKIIAVKFIALPIITMIVLTIFNIRESYPILAKFMIIQSSSPAATAIIIQVRAYGGDYHKMGSIMLICYLLAMFVMPFWLAIWQVL
ncbi:MAG: AEC family transporter [Kiritimatiellae bacterium]|nr:AEC family transporter [Kiritimatiellia bacterium]